MSDFSAVGHADREAAIPVNRSLRFQLQLQLPQPPREHIRASGDQEICWGRVIDALRSRALQRTGAELTKAKADPAMPRWSRSSKRQTSLP